MRSQQRPTTAPRVSFGVELEFFVAFVLEGEADPDEAIKDGIQPLVVVPKVQDNWTKDVKHEPPTEWVFGQLRKALAKAGLPVFLGGEHMTPESVQASHSKSLSSSFSFKEDCTLYEFNIDGYRFQKVEMISPAMYDMPLSFNLIRLAVSVITTNFRCRVNPSCGFHVHVGAGPTERIDARTLRNFAALLWAADPLISRLHAPWRAITKFSQSGRVNNITGLGKNDGPSDVLLKEMTESRNFGGGWASTTEGFLPHGVAALPRPEMKRVKYWGRDRQLGESVEPDTDDKALQREVEFDTVDDVAALKGEPWIQRTSVPPPATTKGSTPLSSDEFGFPRIDYKPPVHRPQNWERPRKSTITSDAPPRPRPPPIQRRYPRITGTMRKDCREDPTFLEPYLYRHDRHGFLDNPGDYKPPLRKDVMSGVRDILGADMTSAQVGELMRHDFISKHINYKFDGYGLRHVKGMTTDGGDKNPWGREETKENTIEFREAAGSLNMEWIAAWAKICCRLLEWSRDAPPSEFMAVIRLLAWTQEEGSAVYGQPQYDVIDFLIDLGLCAEARLCEERVHKGEEVFWECLNFEPNETARGVLWVDDAWGGYDDVAMGGTKGCHASWGSVSGDKDVCDGGESGETENEDRLAAWVTADLDVAKNF